MRRISICFVLMCSLSIGQGVSNEDERKIKIQQHEAARPSGEALERRTRSIAFLKSKGVPTIDRLPVIEDSLSSKLRTPSQIAERLIGCTICAVGGETGDGALVKSLVSDFQAPGFLTPREAGFISKGMSNDQERVQFSWQYERSWVLLWALGYIDRLDYPPSICDVTKLVTLIHGKSVAQLIKDARPRSPKEILDEADLIYRLDWAVVNDRVNKTAKLPKEVEKGVVAERHSALNWLIGYMGQDWDDISTDT